MWKPFSNIVTQNSFENISAGPAKPYLLMFHLLEHQETIVAADCAFLMSERSLYATNVDAIIVLCTQVITNININLKVKH